MALKSLKTLIRLQKRELDMLRREIVSLQTQRQQCIDATQRLDEELLAEQERAAGMPEMAVFFGSFAQAIKARQESLMMEVAKLEKQIDELAEKVAEKFGEQKKYEIIHDRKLEELAKEEQRKENAELDEISTVRYVRKSKEEA